MLMCLSNNLNGNGQMVDFKIEMARIVRDSTHNLVIDEKYELDNPHYFSRLKYFITMLEGSSNEAYIDGILDLNNSKKFISAKKFHSLSNQMQEKLRLDCKKKFGKSPITTVGIGVNIESESVHNRYDALLGEDGLMNQVYYGKANLTDEQISIIFKDGIITRLDELHKIYNTDWRKLRVNERIGILSLYFNLPGLVDESTSFRGHIHNYISTNDSNHLKQAVIEVQDHSNLRKNPGIQNRRNAEATLIASYESPTYTKPSESPDSKKVEVATPGETIIPLNQDNECGDINPGYFIWRTKMDSKVRDDHAILEGKVFRNNDSPIGYLPGKSHNCRCIMEALSNDILIKYKKSMDRAIDFYFPQIPRHT